MGFFPDQKPSKYGRYILLDRINVGGMAEVFRGKMQGVEGFERLVALKRILPSISSDPDFIEMFVDEAKLAVQFQHANIAQVFDLGKFEDTYYIAMEYVSGVDLRTMWDRARNRNRLLPIAMSCYIMQRCCEGLDAAHRKKDGDGRDIGLVHRDVSPQNVLISFEGEVKLIDFGIAKSKSKVSKTQAGILKGKFGYMSPEQVRGVDLDNRSDIFACGAVLYELVVGDRLFLGESDFSTLEKVRNVEMVPPTRLNKNLSPHLERIVMKALAKNREDRYRWASEMAEDLQRYLFSSNQPFARTDMQRYLAQHFKEEMEKEKERLDKYRSISFATFADEETTGSNQGNGASRSTPGMTGQTEVGSLMEVRKQLHDDSERAMRPDRVPTALQPKPMAFDVDPRAPTQAGRSGSTAARGSQPSVIGHLGGGGSAGSYVGQHAGEARRARMPAWAAGLIGGLIAIIMVAAGVVGWKVMQPQLGAVTITATPARVDVYLDDKLMSNSTPYTLDRPPGTYTFTVKKDGYEPEVRAVTIVAGEERREEFPLQKKGGTSSLSVESLPPGLAIFLDGQATGKTTPAQITGLDAGDRQVMLKSGDTIVTLQRVSVKDGAEEKLFFDTAKLPAIVNIESDPTGARVLVNGEDRGITPTTLANLQGKVTIAIRKDGCSPYETRIKVERATVVPISAKLTCPN